jgi:hypothetical protein
MFGLRLQAEAIWRRVDFDVAGTLPYREQILITGDLVGTAYARASYLGWGWYGLMGYELPLDRWLGDVRIMPFAMYEDNNYSDTMPFMGQKFLNAGLNIRPSPYVVIKAEYSLIAPRDKRLSDKIHSVATQVAVSF